MTTLLCVWFSVTGPVMAALAVPLPVETLPGLALTVATLAVVMGAAEERSR